MQLQKQFFFFGSHTAKTLPVLRGRPSISSAKPAECSGSGSSQTFSARQRQRRRQAAGWRRGHQREAETPQHRSLSETRYAAGPDTRNRTSNPDSGCCRGGPPSGEIAQSPCQAAPPSAALRHFMKTSHPLPQPRASAAIRRRIWSREHRASCGERMRCPSGPRACRSASSATLRCSRLACVV